MNKIDFTSPVVKPQYYAQVCYSVQDGNDVDKIDNHFFKLKHSDTLEAESNSGGPCWDPYFEITGSDRNEVTEFTNKTIRILKRFKCVTRIYN
jgi:hypothetical protein